LIGLPEMTNSGIAMREDGRIPVDELNGRIHVDNHNRLLRWETVSLVTGQDHDGSMEELQLDDQASDLAGQRFLKKCLTNRID
jgi:hypothetical protein